MADPSSVYSSVSSRDGKVTVKGGDAFGLVVESAGTAGPVVTFREHGNHVNGIDISPDNQLVASVDQSGVGYVWDAGPATSCSRCAPRWRVTDTRAPSGASTASCS